MLAGILRLVTARFELECGRRFARDASATFEFDAQEMDLRVDRYPVESVSGFHLKSSEAGGWTEVSDVEHLILPARSIIRLSQPLGAGGEIGRVTYAGGYVLPGETAGPGQTPLPAELELAAAEQAAYWHQNRNRLGLLSVGGGSGGVPLLQELGLLPGSSPADFKGTAWFKFSGVDLLPGVASVLRRYERKEW